MRRIYFLSVIAISAFCAQAQSGFILKGNIKTSMPVTVAVTSLSGQVILKTDISKTKGAFELGPVSITPDLYILSMGKTKQPVYFISNTVSINGYYDDVDNRNSSLEFEGLNEHFKVEEFAPKKINDTLNPQAFTALNPKQLSALAYLFHNDQYDFNNNILQKIPENERMTEAAKWLVKTVDSLHRYTIGIEASDFSLPDENNKMVALKDFRGKFVVLDFWASWCGPCRREMQNFKTFYKEFEPDVQFISISMDNDKEKYRQGLKEMEIPWVKLWDETGFSEEESEEAGFFKSSLRAQYGFKQIPFCVILDKNGTVLKRGNLNGEALKNALTEITGSISIK